MISLCSCSFQEEAQTRNSAPLIPQIAAHSKRQILRKTEGICSGVTQGRLLTQREEMARTRLNSTDLDSLIVEPEPLEYTRAAGTGFENSLQISNVCGDTHEDEMYCGCATAITCDQQTKPMKRTT